MYYISVEIKRKKTNKKSNSNWGMMTMPSMGALLLLTAESGTVGGPWPLDGMALITKSEGERRW
jgi:hypothetical protein